MGSKPHEAGQLADSPRAESPPGESQLAGGASKVLVAVKMVDLRPEVDPLTGVVHTGSASGSIGLSAADEAAVEAAMRLAEELHPSGLRIEAVCVGSHDPTEVLRGLIARGVHQARWVRTGGSLPSAMVAEELAAAADGAVLVVCGDYSADRGSGAVPSFIGWHLGWPAACGLRSLAAEFAEPTQATRSLLGVRRLDGGRREDVRITLPAVVSVEAGNFGLRRAPLTSLIAAHQAEILVSGPTVIEDPGHAGGGSARAIPFRPPTKPLSGPEESSALDRIVEVTGALATGNTSRTVHASPDEAAELIIEQLALWGYLHADSSPTP